MVCCHVHIVTVFAIETLSTDITRVGKLAWKVNLYMFPQVTLIFICFATSTARVKAGQFIFGDVFIEDGTPTSIIR